MTQCRLHDYPRFSMLQTPHKQAAPISATSSSFE